VIDTEGATPTNFSVLDTTTNIPLQINGAPYSGPVAGLRWEFIDPSTDNLNVTANVPNVFIHTGSGEDAIDVSHANGNNVLDGSTGSNFLVGGSGNDTFFLDDRSPSADIWSTVSNFHAGEAATILPKAASRCRGSMAGATGFTGLTLHVTDAGHPTASLTLPGFSSADLSNGRISTSWGSEANGTPYLYVHANSVTALIAEGLISLDEIAVDGTKVRANASRKSFRTSEKLLKIEAAVVERLASLKQELSIRHQKFNFKGVHKLGSTSHVNVNRT
jgi:hypothetical protein